MDFRMLACLLDCRQVLSAVFLSLKSLQNYCKYSKTDNRIFGEMNRINEENRVVNDQLMVPLL